MKFRFDINALRALGVIFVVLYHFNVPCFSGGYIGVDIFFVISGYLMSGIILTKIGDGSFSFFDFYLRRAQRIIPALVTVVLFTVLLSNVFYFQEMESKIAKYGISSILFISNLTYYLNSGYFDLSSKANPLLHTWSLSVEWQFYIIYPVALYTLKRLYKDRRNVFEWIVYFFIVSGFISILYISNKHPSFSFYSLTSRYWEMLVGCVVFLNEKKIVEKTSNTFRKTSTLISFITILFFVVYKNDSLYWPSAYTLVPIVCTAIIIASNVDIYIFRLRIIQFLGKISYSLYLWHWPLFVFCISIGLDDIKYTPYLLLLSVILSLISYKYIEKSTFKRGTILFWALIGILISLGVYKFPINSFFYSEQNLKVVNFLEEHKNELKEQIIGRGCFIHSKDEYEDFNAKECLEIDKNRKNVLLLGDSHAAHFSYSLNEYFTKRNINMLQATASKCFPVINSKGKGEYVKLTNYMFSEFIPKNKENIGLVIISANWKDLQGYTYPELKIKLTELVKYLESNNLEYRFLGQTETYTVPFPEIVAKKERLRIVVEENFIDQRSLDARNLLMNTLPPNKYIDLFRVGSIKHLSDDRTIPYMFDDNHFSLFGAEQIVKYAASQNAF